MVWAFSILACSRQYASTLDLTATVQAVRGGIGGYTDPTIVVPTDGIVEKTVIATKPSPTQPTPTPTISATPAPPILYTSQSGDTLPALAARFGVMSSEITSTEELPAWELINPDQLLIIANRLGETGPSENIIPDSEVVYSPSGLDFDIDGFVDEAGGYLSTYRQYLDDGWYSGAQVIQRVATETSINPRLLLALVEYQGGWVYDQPRSLALTDYPLGYNSLDRQGLYKQLTWAVHNLSYGYYAWREGRLQTLDFEDGESVRMAPTLNAGTAAVQVLFSKLYDEPRWLGVLNGTGSFTELYENMYGNPWIRAQTVEPLFPPDLTQPELTLPFRPNRVWSFTGGPHSAWGPNSSWAALDFAPSTTESGCVESDDWVTASASGVVVRSKNGVVVLDLDGDGREQTGWVILYLHIAAKDRIAVGTELSVGDVIGHPSCEGGDATGTHVHIVRKYNGEWIPADGPLPFTLSGWRAHFGSKEYEGTLTKENEIVTASPYGSYETRISYTAD
jgi:LysM repeat protein